MLYDFEFYTNRPSYYSRPRYYSPYSPNNYSYSSYLKDRYYYPYRYYQTPWYRTPLPYASASAYYPYRPNYSYTPKVSPPIYPEAEKYAYTYGLDFDSTAKDIRSATFRLLQDARRTLPRAGSVPRFERDSSVPRFERESSVPRFARASSLERPSFEGFIDTDDDYYRATRAVSSQRMMSEGPTSSYRNYVY